MLTLLALLLYSQKYLHFLHVKLNIWRKEAEWKTNTFLICVILCQDLVNRSLQATLITIIGALIYFQGNVFSG